MALQSHDKKFLVAEENGKATTKIEKHLNSEVFEVNFMALDKVQFKGYYQKYLSVEPNGNVNANQQGRATLWSTYYQRMTWTVEHSMWNKGFAMYNYTFKSNDNGKYLEHDNHGALNAIKSNVGLWGHFKIINVKGKKA